jgi:hypothetical protein
VKIPRHLIEALVQALRLPPDYTGKHTVTVHIHKGTVGKVTFGVEETLPAADWIRWCRQAHERPLPARAVDELHLMELERMWPGKTDP